MMDLGAEKLEMTAGTIEPIFNDYLTEFLQSIPDNKASRVFLARYADAVCVLKPCSLGSVPLSFALKDPWMSCITISYTPLV